MSSKRLLVFILSFAFMATAMGGTAAADDKGGRKAKKKDKGAQVLPEIIVPGSVHRPGAIYILPRAGAPCETKPAAPDNLKKVVSSVEDSVF